MHATGAEAACDTCLPTHCDGETVRPGGSLHPGTEAGVSITASKTLHGIRCEIRIAIVYVVMASEFER